MAPKELNFITGNKHKLKEVGEILSVTSVELRSQNLDIPELQGTIEEVTTAKCRAAADIVRQTRMIMNESTAGWLMICHRSKDPYWSKTTCLSFQAFGGELPGPYVYVC